MTFEAQLNTLLKYIQSHHNCKKRELGGTEELEGVNVEQCLRKLIKDGHVVGYWKAGQKREETLQIRANGNLFLEQGGYGAANVYNSRMFWIAVASVVLTVVTIILSVWKCN